MTNYEQSLARIANIIDPAQRRAALVGLRDQLHLSSGSMYCESPQAAHVKKLIDELDGVEPEVTWMDIAKGHENRYHIHRNGISHEIKAGSGTQNVYVTKFGKRDAELVALELLCAFHDGIQAAITYMKKASQPPSPIAEQAECSTQERGTVGLGSYVISDGGGAGGGGGGGDGALYSITFGTAYGGGRSI